MPHHRSTSSHRLGPVRSRAGRRTLARLGRGSRAGRTFLLSAVGLLGACGGFPVDKSELAGLDMDGDGAPLYDEQGQIFDCDDTNPDVRPNAQEYCDGLDNNCDGGIDTAPAEPGYDKRDPYWVDSDGDGFGDAIVPPVRMCEATDGFVDNYDDCDDSDPDRYTGAPEVCDGKDNDCDNLEDEDAVDAPSWFLDGDLDGYGTDANFVVACSVTDTNRVLEGGDCDDDDSTVHPGAAEVCDGEDNNCDDVVDLGVDLADADYVLYTDGDGDGFGADGTATGSCAASVAGYADVEGDCDDADGTAYPGSTESEISGDGIDQDCDGDDDCTDLDCDGLADVVVPWVDDVVLPWRDDEDTVDGRAMTMLLSAGSGFAASERLLGSAASTTDLWVGDIDGDGYVDLVQATPLDGGGAVRSSSMLHFGPFDSEHPDHTGDTLALAVDGGGTLGVGDFDADGVLDLVVGVRAGEGAVQSAVFMAVDAGDGTPTDTFETGVVHAIEVADLDGDGHDDLVVCHGPERDDPTGWDDDLLVMFGSPAGLDVSAPVAVVTGCVDVVAGSLDADADLELVVARDRDAVGDRLDSVVAKLDGAGGFTTDSALATEDAASVQLVDIDGNGHLDAIFGAGFDLQDAGDDTDGSWDTAVQIHLSEGFGLSPTASVVLPALGAVWPIVADFDADGRLDVVAPGQAPGSGGTVTTAVYRGQSSGDLFAAASPISYSSWIYGVAHDVDSDGDLDVLATTVGSAPGLVTLRGTPSGLENVELSVSSGGTTARPPIVVE